MKKHFQMNAAERVEAYTARAMQKMQAGTFASKAAQKDVFSDLNWAYDSVKTLVRELGMDSWDFFYVSKKAPVDLHNVKERHIEAFDTLADTVRLLMDLRAEAKAMEIVKRVVEESAEDRAMAVLPTTSGKLDAETLRKAAAAWKNITAAELLEFQPSFQIDVRVHDVINYAGTHFYRRMFFRNDKRESFASIMADYNRELQIWLAGRVA